MTSIPSVVFLPPHEFSSRSLSRPAVHQSSSPAGHDLKMPHPHPMQGMSTQGDEVG